MNASNIMEKEVGGGKQGPEQFSLENHLLKGNIIQMHVSDSVAGRPLLFLSETHENKHMYLLER